jgi:surface antigen
MTKPSFFSVPRISAITLALAASFGLGQTPALARAKIEFVDVAPRTTSPALMPSSALAQPALQCVPSARMVSGIQLRGDAHTWWKQAGGQYARGFTPKVGAVMAFKPYGPMVLGHVAAVSRIIDSRTILLRHANWSPINGQRGQIEDNVRAVDVSPRNDWSEVRVWFDPLRGLGSTHWPVDGFIYNRPAQRGEHATTRASWTSDPIGAIIAAFSRR